MIRHLTSKIAIIIYVLILIGLAVWAFPIVKDRYFNPSPDKTIQTQDSQDGSQPQQQPQQAEDGNISEDDSVTTDNSLVQVQQKDCANECKDFSDQKDVDYCKQVCGLSEPVVKAEGCDALQGMDKDYCLKDLAVSKDDMSICDGIKDGGIKKTCENRITEDIIDQQQMR